jgi:hypothetical protein
VPQIEVDDRTYRELELLAVAWHTTIAEAVARLVMLVTRDGERVSVHPEPRYTGERIDEGRRQ